MENLFAEKRQFRARYEMNCNCWNSCSFKWFKGIAGWWEDAFHGNFMCFFGWIMCFLWEFLVDGARISCIFTLVSFQTFSIDGTFLFLKYLIFLIDGAEALNKYALNKFDKWAAGGKFKELTIENKISDQISNRNLTLKRGE